MAAIAVCADCAIVYCCFFRIIRAPTKRQAALLNSDRVFLYQNFYFQSKSIAFVSKTRMMIRLTILPNNMIACARVEKQSCQFVL